ncbi:hypothetical protein JW979_11210, partial [bacterium]|nr:hypothetical protein [candidate division CSSED10-310 bacterium]
VLWFNNHDVMTYDKYPDSEQEKKTSTKSNVKAKSANEIREEAKSPATRATSRASIKGSHPEDEKEQTQPLENEDEE